MSGCAEILQRSSHGVADIGVSAAKVLCRGGAYMSRPEQAESLSGNYTKSTRVA